MMISLIASLAWIGISIAFGIELNNDAGIPYFVAAAITGIAIGKNIAQTHKGESCKVINKIKNCVTPYMNDPLYIYSRF
jgi:hypothetical protein